MRFTNIVGLFNLKLIKMKHSTNWLLIFFIAFGLGVTGCAQEDQSESVLAEIQQMNEKEQKAFINGDCEELLNLMDDNITFFINGNKAPSKDFIMNMCQKMPRPFNQNGEHDTKFYVLTEDSGFVVKTINFDKDEGNLKNEVVTKIWKKTKDGWKMTHLHSTALNQTN